MSVVGGGKLTEVVGSCGIPRVVEKLPFAVAELSGPKYKSFGSRRCRLLGR